MSEKEKKVIIETTIPNRERREKSANVQDRLIVRSEQSWPKPKDSDKK